MRTRSESGSTLLISLILLVLLVMLGATLLSLSAVESTISHNELWSEAAFHSAEAGIHAGIDQLSADPVAATQPIAETPIADDHSRVGAVRGQRPVGGVRGREPGAKPRLVWREGTGSDSGPRGER